MTARLRPRHTQFEIEHSLLAIGQTRAVQYKANGQTNRARTSGLGQVQVQPLDELVPALSDSQETCSALPTNEGYFRCTSRKCSTCCGRALETLGSLRPAIDV